MHLALYQPDIPQNVGAAMRLCAALNLTLHIIEPCGFPWDSRKIRRSGMDYVESVTLETHTSWDAFLAKFQGRNRIILLTTQADMAYTDFAFKPDDILLMGRESAGVPETVHNTADARLIIPLYPGMRSLNVINAAAMITGEALRQTKGFTYASAQTG